MSIHIGRKGTRHKAAYGIGRVQAIHSNEGAGREVPEDPRIPLSRELPRTRLKFRIPANLTKYKGDVTGFRDRVGKPARNVMERGSGAADHADDDASVTGALWLALIAGGGEKEMEQGIHGCGQVRMLEPAVYTESAGVRAVSANRAA